MQIVGADSTATNQNNPGSFSPSEAYVRADATRITDFGELLGIRRIDDAL
jgi:hypothetical protein